MKEVSFKILHRIYPVKHVLERFKLNINYSCDFCGLNKETIFHLFFHCMYSKIFWNDMQIFLSRKTGQMFMLSGSDIFIYFENNSVDKNVSFLIQLFINYGKFHIHKMKWTNRKPNLTLFLIDIELYYNFLVKLQNKEDLTIFKT